jgi:hypothetical protein
MPVNYRLSSPFATYQLDLFETRKRLPSCGRSSHSFCEVTLITSSQLWHCPRCDGFAPYVTATSSSCHA